VLLLVFVILILFITVTLFPVPKSTLLELEDSVLLKYKEDANWGNFIDIKILNDGSIEIIDSLTLKERVVKTKISDQKLQELKKLINSKAYSLETESLLGTRLNMDCFDCGSTSYWINRNGKTILISPETEMADLIESIREEALSQLENNKVRENIIEQTPLPS